MLMLRCIVVVHFCVDVRLDIVDIISILSALHGNLEYCTILPSIALPLFSKIARNIFDGKIVCMSL
jgi:hypothetical protein